MVKESVGFPNLKWARDLLSHSIRHPAGVLLVSGKRHTNNYINHTNYTLRCFILYFRGKECKNVRDISTYLRKFRHQTGADVVALSCSGLLAWVVVRESLERRWGRPHMFLLDLCSLATVRLDFC